MASVTTTSKSGTAREDLWRCVRCGSDANPGADDSVVCGACGAVYPTRDGVLVVRDEITGNNEVARKFYDGPTWPKFRFWEWLTFITNGGERRSRNKVLKHLPKGENLNLLDVAVGDGVYLPWLPQSWSVVGIDVSRVQLESCKPRIQGRDVRLVHGEAEDLPFRDGTFDACLSIGAFNYFNDPEKSLREMARTVKPGGTIVISDEVPNLTDRAVFHKIGLASLDRWLIHQVTKHLGDEFNAMVERYKNLDIAAIGKRVLDDCEYRKIWQGVGYVLVGKVPG